MKHLRKKGFALPIILIIIALLSVLSMGLSQMARNLMLDLQLRKDLWADEKLAQDILHQTVYGLMVGNYSEQELSIGGQVIPLDGRPVNLSGAQVSIQDGAGLFSLAIYDRVKFKQLLQSLTDTETASKISAELADWIDADNNRQFQGMESANYISSGLLQSPRNEQVRSLEELLELPSMTPEILNGGDGKKGLVDLVLAGGNDFFNIATAPDNVLGAFLGVSSGVKRNLLSARKQKNWVEMQRLVNRSNWIFNDVSPLTHGSRYLFSIQGSSGATVKVQIMLTPQKEERLFTLIDWHAPYYKSE